MIRIRMERNEDNHYFTGNIEWKDFILSNLIQYYRCFENEDKVHFLKENGLEMILNKSSGWPNFILGCGELEQSKTSLIKNILDGTYPPFWIIRDEENQEQLFRKHGFLLVNRWAGMGILLNDNSLPNVIPDIISIMRVKKVNQMEDWFSVAESAALKNYKVDFEQFRPLMTKQEVQFFVGYIGTSPVSSASLFFSDTVAGIYLVATKLSFRNHGYATALTKHLLNVARKAGYHKIVLHANPKAVNIYYNLGFRTFCNLNIFWFPPIK
jgi:ribosomal protein S18 acetylase RimI-like enzyme